jgi:hypothetical protein
MKLAEIMRLALRQLDEDPADISDYADLFRSYANIGYKIAVSQYYKPVDTLMLHTDDKGKVYVDGMGIERIVSLKDDMERDVFYDLSSDGTTLRTGKRDADLTAIVGVEYPPLQEDTDEPRIPAHAHHALVDYICYRHLLSGNAAKQNRATAYLQQFMQAMQLIRPQGSGSVTRFKNLYTATDIRNVGW